MAPLQESQSLARHSQEEGCNHPGDFIDLGREKMVRVGHPGHFFRFQETGSPLDQFSGVDYRIPARIHDQLRFLGSPEKIKRHTAYGRGYSHQSFDIGPAVPDVQTDPGTEGETEHGKPTFRQPGTDEVECGEQIVALARPFGPPPFTPADSPEVKTKGLKTRFAQFLRRTCHEFGFHCPAVEGMGVAEDDSTIERIGSGREPEALEIAGRPFDDNFLAAGHHARIGMTNSWIGTPVTRGPSSARYTSTSLRTPKSPFR